MQAVGINRIVAESRVAKATLYRYFPSKEDLVVAVMELREELWSHDWLEREVEQAGGPPGARLLAIFDAFGRWFRRRDFENCLFIGVLLENHDHRNQVGKEAVKRLANGRSFVRGLAEQGGASDPDGLAHEWQTLMSGSLIGAAQGHRDAADRARAIGVLILDREGIEHGRSA